ncbi:MAG TPA: hypothetical protein VK211_17665 [Kamptonema sp.]|nr:hypothetical protein [Kamptonema sp.]
MENWEFLLQKEGDRAWLPLESPDVEILEGRYRIVARSTLANTEIEVRITHQLAEEVPPQRRVQKRSTRTNPEGLMVVIPYTSLKPGIWELSCLADPGEKSAETSQHTVQLQVLPTESEDLDTEELVAITTEESTSANIEESQSIIAISTPETTANSQKPELFTPAESASSAPISVAVKPEPEKLRSPLAENLSPSPQNSSLLSKFNLRLTLEKQSLVAQLGQPLIIYGQVEVSENSSRSSTNAEITETQTESLRKAIAQTEFQICLRDPQTSQVLVDIRQPLPAQPPPCFFGCTIYLPSDCQTRLILGEAFLWDGTVLLATESFTITAHLQQLLAVIAQDFSEEDHQVTTPEATAKQEAAALNESFANLKETLKESVSSDFQLSPTGQLPPQITARSAITPPTQSLDLPPFGQPIPKSNSKISPLEISSLVESGANLETKPKSDDPKVPPLLKTTTTFSELLVQSFLGAAKQTDDSPTGTSETPANSEQDGDTESKTNPEMPESQPEVSETELAREKGFLNLKLQDRFLTRLSALANDGEFSEWLKKSMSPALEGLTETGVPGSTEVLSADAIEGKPDAESEEITADGDRTPNTATPGKPDWVAREFVVFDDPLPPREAKKVNLEVESDRQDEATQRIPYVLPEEEQVPTPELDILSREIVAGRLIKARVRLPELTPRIYVKIWVYDRQSYVILDGPRWITEFSPNGLGSIEAIAELEIAYGSLEVEFEAIAVEMQTLRESHKATVHRRVVPPAGPSLPLDK